MPRMLGFAWLRALPAVAALAWACAPSANAQTIYGSLSNFDVPNETDDECDEFEIELHGPHPEDIYHTYHNPNYGAPEIYGTATGTVVRYANPRHHTLPGSIEHFGVSLRNFNADPTPKFAWKLDGVIPGTNPYPLQPQIVAEMGLSPEGDRVMIETVTNLDPYNRRMWIQRSVTNVMYAVTLEDLMTNDPLVQGSEDLDNAPMLLNAGQSLRYDQLEAGDGIASAVINYDVYRDRVLGGQHVRGDFAGTVMNAVVLSTSTCDDGGLVITVQPVDAVGFPGDDVDFDCSVDNNGDAGPVTFEWFHEGVAIPDSNSDSITIRNIVNADAGTYYCQATNQCGVVITSVGRLTMPLPCHADFDQNGFVNGTDFDDFVDAFYWGRTAADFDANGFVNGDDFDGFILAFFYGC